MLSHWQIIAQICCYLQVEKLLFLRNKPSWVCLSCTWKGFRWVLREKENKQKKRIKSFSGLKLLFHFNLLYFFVKKYSSAQILKVTSQSSLVGLMKIETPYTLSNNAEDFCIKILKSLFHFSVSFIADSKTGRWYGWWKNQMLIRINICFLLWSLFCH